MTALLAKRWLRTLLGAPEHLWVNLEGFSNLSSAGQLVSGNPTPFRTILLPTTLCMSYSRCPLGIMAHWGIAVWWRPAWGPGGWWFGSAACCPQGIFGEWVTVSDDLELSCLLHSSVCGGSITHSGVNLPLSLTVALNFVLESQRFGKQSYFYTKCHFLWNFALGETRGNSDKNP